jgi:hypothetical protein
MILFYQVGMHLYWYAPNKSVIKMQKINTISQAIKRQRDNSNPQAKRFDCRRKIRTE